MTRGEQLEVEGKRVKHDRATHTFCELSILVGELLLPVELQEAVVPQATCVRQTLHNRVEEALR